MTALPFKPGDRVTLKSNPQWRGVVNHVIDGNAPVPYFWVNWVANGIYGHRASELELTK